MKNGDFQLDYAILEQLINISYQSKKPSCSRHVDIMSQEGIMVEHTLYRIITKNPDVDPLVVVPRAKNGVDTLEIKIVFHGTISGGGWHRNITGVGGAGFNSFKEQEKLIIKKIQQLLNQQSNNQKLHLTFVGYSLGGADAQNLMMAVMKGLSQDFHDFGNVQQLSLGIFNSAGVPKEVAKKSHELAQILKNKGIQINARFLIAGGDICQQTGDSMILNNLHPKNGEVNLLKIKTPYEEIWDNPFDVKKVVKVVQGAYLAHTTSWFLNPSNDQLGYKFYTNQNEKHREKIKEELLNKLATKIPVTYQVITHAQQLYQVKDKAAKLAAGVGVLYCAYKSAISMASPLTTLISNKIKKKI